MYVSKPSSQPTPELHSSIESEEDLPGNIEEVKFHFKIANYKWRHYYCIKMTSVTKVSIIVVV